MANKNKKESAQGSNPKRTRSGTKNTRARVSIVTRIPILSQSDKPFARVVIDGYIWASMCAKIGLPKTASIGEFYDALPRR